MSLAASLHGNAGQLADPLEALLLAVDRLAQNALVGGHGRRRSGVVRISGNIGPTNRSRIRCRQ